MSDELTIDLQWEYFVKQLERIFEQLKETNKGRYSDDIWAEVEGAYFKKLTEVYDKIYKFHIDEETLEGLFFYAFEDVNDQLSRDQRPIVKAFGTKVLEAFFRLRDEELKKKEKRQLEGEAGKIIPLNEERK